MKTLKLIAIPVILVIGMIVGGATVKPAQATFDHNNCQYPTRTTNPANGCDNSDPCDPAQTKGGSGDCIDTSQGSTATPEGPKGSPPYSDPNRDYYDQYGNRYKWDGTLLEAAPNYAGEPAPTSPYKTLPDVGAKGSCQNQ